MRKALSVVALAGVLTISAVAQSDASSVAIFSPSTVKRAEALMRQMTLEEKAGQLNQLFMFAPTSKIDDLVRTGKIGSLLYVSDPAEVNRMQHLAVDGSRLHIPLIFGGYYSRLPHHLSGSHRDGSIVGSSDGGARAGNRGG